LIDFLSSLLKTWLKIICDIVFFNSVIYDTKNINIYFSLRGFCPEGICPGGFYPRLVKYIFDCHVYSLRFVRYILNVLFVSINVKIKKYRFKKLLFIILWYLIKMNVNCLNRITFLHIHRGPPYTFAQITPLNPIFMGHRFNLCWHLLSHSNDFDHQDISKGDNSGHVIIKMK
jgi:hypothetical protein